MEIKLEQKQMLNFDRAADAKNFAYAEKIRTTVFVQEQNRPLKLEIDKFDDEARHYLLFIGDKPVGTARMFLIEPEVARIGRLAILKEYRKKALGAELMEHIVAEVKANTVAKKIIISAPISSIPFCIKCSFTESGKEYDEAGVMHIDMTKEISLLPA
ncbi:MAG: GNAT family N-acetyltransferase [Alphaproteobacteria bacterium]